MCKLKSLKKYRFLWTAIYVLCFVFTTMAQTESARIQGTVTDQVGASVPNATLTVTDLGTNREVTVQTNGEGAYSILTLQPGKYQIAVTQSNFKTTKQEITLEVAQTATLDFTLETGAVSETVTITNDTPLVDSSSSALGEVIQGRQIVELPLNGRNVIELARLVPGVTQGVVGGFATGVGGDAETYRGNNVGGAALSVNGQRTQSNNYLLDGVDNNEALVGTINIFPTADSVQEFRIQTSVAPSEFGRGGGGIVNAAIKSGTNAFHGSAFTFIRNSVFDARQTFDPTKSLFRRGQFGGSIGGPIFLPRFGEGGPTFYNGKDKVFFFADYEGLRQFLPRGRETASVPTAEFRNGNFSALTTQLRDPLTGLNICNTPGNATCNGTPYNRLDLLPGGRLNQAALNYLRAFPLPNISGAGTQNNYEAFRNQTENNNTFNVRVDGNINDRNQLFTRISYGNYDQEVTSRLPNLPAGFGSGTNPTRNRAIVVGLNSSLTDNLFNEFRIQAARLKFGYEPPFGDTPVSQNLGIVNANRDSSLGGGALIGGYNGQLEYTGDFGPYRVPQNTYQVVEGMSYTTGNHTFKFGGTILRRQVDLFRPNRGKGYFFLYGNGDFTQCRNENDPESASGTTRFEQADLLIGFVCNYQVGPPFGTVGTRTWENGFFGQDDWRVSRKLTLNLGLRYEYFTNPTEEYGRQSNFDIQTGRLLLAKDGKDSLTETDKNNFSPRVGFAYDIFGKGKSVLRGGYGIFYFLDRGGIDNQLAQNAPFSGFSVCSYRDGCRITLSGRAPNGSNDNRLATGALPLGDISSVNLNNPSGIDVLAVLPDNKISNTQQFNIQFQQQLTNDTAISVGYVGTRGRNLALYYNLNGRTVEPGTNVGCPRSLVNGRCFSSLNRVNVRDDNGKSQYDSLQVQLERRFAQGWQYLLSYAYSRTKDNGNGAFDSVGDTNINFIEPYARSRSDYPHTFVFSSIYEIPFGRGRQFGSDIPRVLDAIIGGFQLNGIFRAQSGSAFDIRRDGVRVDLVGDPYGGTTEKFLDRAAFRLAPAGRFGNLERNGLRSPSTYVVNLGVSKNFGISEDAKIQFRTEFFNLLNTPQLSQPDTNFDTGNNNFGRIQGTQFRSARQIQFGLRLEF